MWRCFGCVPSPSATARSPWSAYSEASIRQQHAQRLGGRARQGAGVHDCGEAPLDQAHREQLRGPDRAPAERSPHAVRHVMWTPGQGSSRTETRRRARSPPLRSASPDPRPCPSSTMLDSRGEKPSSPPSDASTTNRPPSPSRRRTSPSTRAGSSAWSSEFVKTTSTDPSGNWTSWKSPGRDVGVRLARVEVDANRETAEVLERLDLGAHTGSETEHTRLRLHMAGRAQAAPKQLAVLHVVVGKIERAELRRLVPHVVVVGRVAARHEAAAALGRGWALFTAGPPFRRTRARRRSRVLLIRPHYRLTAWPRHRGSTSCSSSSTGRGAAATSS